MKRCGWLFLTFSVLFLAGTVLTPARAPEARRPRPAACCCIEDAREARTAGLFASPAARRWYDAVPHHWRACLLQR